MNGAESRPVRVMCIDDNEMVAESLRRRLEQEPLLQWAGVVSQGAAAYLRVLEQRPDVVLMDIDMPNVDSFAIVEKLAAEAPEVRVIMFSGHVSGDYIEKALDSGAWGYLSKNDHVGWLIEGIKRAGRGEFVFSTEVEAVRRIG